MLRTKTRALGLLRAVCQLALRVPLVVVILDPGIHDVAQASSRNPESKTLTKDVVALNSSHSTQTHQKAADRLAHLHVNQSSSDFATKCPCAPSIIFSTTTVYEPCSLDRASAANDDEDRHSVSTRKVELNLKPIYVYVLVPPGRAQSCCVFHIKCTVNTLSDLSEGQAA